MTFLESLSIQIAAPQYFLPQFLSVSSGSRSPHRMTYTGIESGNWINGVGNLMLISGSHNKSIGNRPFDEKLASYDSLSLLKQQLEIKDFSTNNNGALIWDLNAIKKRKDALIEAALQIWSLDTI